jgi:hypothetical protein
MASLGSLVICCRLFSSGSFSVVLTATKQQPKPIAGLRLFGLVGIVDEPRSTSFVVVTFVPSGADFHTSDT